MKDDSRSSVRWRLRSLPAFAKWVFLAEAEEKMSIRTVLLAATLILSAALPHKALAQWSFDAEFGLAFQNYNEVRIPNEGGTLFDFNKDFDLEGPVLPFRIRVGYSLNEKNHFFALYAPLTVRYSGAAPRDIQFEDLLFAEGSDIDGLYRFNSYRLTYRRDLLITDHWVLGLGFTAKIRDARVQLESQGVIDRSDDFGFVPLLHLYAAYRSGPWQVYFEGDGLAGGPGRAFDLFGGALYQIDDHIQAKAGYRLLEGGANVSQVYNFTLVQFAIVGLFITI